MCGMSFSSQQYFTLGSGNGNPLVIAASSSFFPLFMVLPLTYMYVFSLPLELNHRLWMNMKG